MTETFPDCVPELTDGVLTLRAHRAEDVDAIVEQCADPESVRWTEVPAPYTADSARSFLGTIARSWEDPDGVRFWALEAADPDDPAAPRRFAGSIDLRPQGGGVLEVGFGLHPWARGRGLMARALRLVSSYAFEVLQARTVRWRALAGNWGSRRVAWSCGFRFDGRQRDLLAHRGGPAADGWVATLRAGEPMRPRTPWLVAPVLEGEGVRLRPFAEHDRPEPGWEPDPESLRFVPGFFPTPQGYDEWLLARGERSSVGESVTWAVCDATSDVALGVLSVFRLDQPLTAGSGEVAYWLDPRARGRGLLGPALGLAVGHAFAPVAHGGLGLHRLGAGTDIDNRASARVLVRAGFRPVGTERSAMAHPEGAADGPLFELLAAERDRPPLRPLTPVELHGDGLVLRGWRATDRPAPQLRPDPAALRFMPPGAQPTDETFDRWLASRSFRTDTGEHVFWAVTEAGGPPLGSVLVFRIGQLDPGSAELGYWLFPHARGRRIADRAVGLVVDHAFEALGLRRLVAHTVADNWASQAVLLRAGFRVTGRERECFEAEGEVQDGVSFELLAGEHPVAGQAARLRALRPPSITGARVRLREWRESDVPRIVAACSDPVTRHFLSDLPSPYDETHARTYLNRCRENALVGHGYDWCVADAATDECLGAVSLSGLEGGATAELGYWVHPDARGRGVATEAARLAARHAVVPVADGGLGLRRLVLQAVAENAGSRAVAEAVGFRRGGTERAAKALRDGTFADMVWYDLLAEEIRG